MSIWEVVDKELNRWKCALLKYPTPFKGPSVGCVSVVCVCAFDSVAE